MIKKILICLIIILFSFSLPDVSDCMNNENKNYDNVILNNINNNKLEFTLKDISFHKEYIDIGEKYNNYAILTINVKNNNKDDFELCDIDVYPFQGNKKTKYFVKTADEDINGFIGTIKKDGDLDIKIGIALYNKNEKIKLNLITNGNMIK